MKTDGDGDGNDDDDDKEGVEKDENPDSNTQEDIDEWGESSKAREAGGVGQLGSSDRSTPVRI